MLPPWALVALSKGVGELFTMPLFGAQVRCGRPKFDPYHLILIILAVDETGHKSWNQHFAALISAA